MASVEKRKTTVASYSLDHMHTNFIDTSYQKWISRQMDARVLEYSDVSKINICCGSWNVNSKPLPEPYDISEWLSLRGNPYADIYAISLQEMVDLNMMNVVLVSSTSDEMSVLWTQKILDTLNNMTGGDNYVLIGERHMVGLLGAVFAKRSVAGFITDFRSTVVYTGGYGTTGNKGGIAMRFDLKDSGMCFISSHFHASRNNVAQRNLDFQTIYESAVFPPGNDRAGAVKRNSKSRTMSNSGAPSASAGPTASTTRPNSVSFKSQKGSLTLDVACHEQIFWLGDLNYRVGGEMDDIDVMNIVERSEWHTLLELDQLNVEREQSNVFQGFEEGKIMFQPTYKFQPKTELYERRPDKKLRAPAWCDRILWKSNLQIKDSMKLLAYHANMKLTISDHRPVAAWFEGIVRHIVPDRMRTVYQDLLFSVDKWINASTPKMEIDNRVHDMGSISLEVRHRVKMKVTNTGAVMVEWAFVPKNDELLVSPPWLKFSPEDGILAPGESMEITATVCIPVEGLGMFFPGFVGGSLSLDEVVILRISKGSDIFCIFSAVVPEENILETRTKAAQQALSLQQHLSVNHSNSTNHPPQQPHHHDQHLPPRPPASKTQVALSAASSKPSPLVSSTTNPISLAARVTQAQIQATSATTPVIEKDDDEEADDTEPYMDMDTSNQAKRGEVMSA